jgi:hypothetical protein
MLPGAGGSICGSVSPAADIDYITFTLPNDATAIRLRTSVSSTAAAKFEASVDGVSFDMGTPTFKKLGVYLIKVTSMNATSFDWEFEYADSN